MIYKIIILTFFVAFSAYSQKGIDVFNSSSENAYEYYYFLEAIRQGNSKIIHSGFDSLNLEALKYQKNNVKDFYSEMNLSNDTEIVQQHNYINSDTASFIRSIYQRDESGKINIKGQIVFKYKNKSRNPLLTRNTSPREIIEFKIYKDSIIYDIKKDIQKIENKRNIGLEINPIYYLIDTSISRSGISNTLRRYKSLKTKNKYDSLDKIMTKNSIRYINSLKNYALYSDSLSITDLSLAEKIFILNIRLIYNYNTLINESTSDLFTKMKYSFAGDECGLSKLDSFNIEKIFHYNTAGYVSLIKGEVEFPSRVIFIYDEHNWKIEFVELFKQLNSLLEYSIGVDQVSDEYITYILNYRFDKDKTKDIWYPLSKRK